MKLYSRVMMIPRELERVAVQAIYGFEKARSLGYLAERAVLESFAHGLMPGFFPKISGVTVEQIGAAKKALDDLLKEDAWQIQRGNYPLHSLTPEQPLRHLTRLPSLLVDSARAAWQRKRGKTAQFSEDAQIFAQDTPRYYRRNFHFQNDGYLSQKSARLYEHQVEILFTGGADAMRRMILKALREKFGKTDGKGLQFLEVGMGTGRTTQFVHQAFPKAKIIGTDLSAPYLEFSQKRLHKSPQEVHLITLMQADGAELPFKDATFDAAYSVFLFHELPELERFKVLRESVRVLRPDGLLALVDSLQLGDHSQLDCFLKQFPDFYHEPFYRNYIEKPIEPMVIEAGVKGITSHTGFFSKLVHSTSR